MNQQVDKFFREKVEGTHKAAPASAWDKIETGLDKKNYKGLWFRVAAAVLIIAVAAFLLWPANKSATPEAPLASLNKQPEVTKSEQVTETPTTGIAVTPPSQHTGQTPGKARKRKTHSASAIQPVIEESKTVALSEEVTDTTELYNSLTIKENEIAIASEESFHIEESSVTEEAVTLVYSAEEINDKYLDKVALAKATSAQKKPSTFRKLLNKAYDLKNNQDPFGELRQKKNEILALNFKSEKSEKQRSQNK